MTSHRDGYTFPSLASAARAWGADRGIVGRAGGYLRTATIAEYDALPVELRAQPTTRSAENMRKAARTFSIWDSRTVNGHCVQGWDSLGRLLHRIRQITAVPHPTRRGVLRYEIAPAPHAETVPGAACAQCGSLESNPRHHSNLGHPFVAPAAVNPVATEPVEVPATELRRGDLIRLAPDSAVLVGRTDTDAMPGFVLAYLFDGYGGISEDTYLILGVGERVRLQRRDMVDGPLVGGRPVCPTASHTRRECPGDTPDGICPSGEHSAALEDLTRRYGRKAQEREAAPAFTTTPEIEAEMDRNAASWPQQASRVLHPNRTDPAPRVAEIDVMTLRRAQLVTRAAGRPTPAPDAPRETVPATELRDGDLFTVDGEAWFVFAVLGWGTVAVYVDDQRGDLAGTLRVDVERDAPVTRIIEPITFDMATLGEAARDALDIIHRGEFPYGTSAVVRGRLRNLGLIVEEIKGYSLTSLGLAVATVLAEHRLTTGRRSLGHGPIRGSGMRYGVNAECSCRAWSGHSNESASTTGLTDVRGYHSRHLNEVLRAPQAATS